MLVIYNGNFYESLQQTNMFIFEWSQNIGFQMQHKKIIDHLFYRLENTAS